MKENSEPVAACVLDVIALVPAVGQAVGLSAKFGKGLALGLNSGVRIAGREGIKSSARTLAERIKLPTTAELASLGKNTLRSTDPGLELVAGFSKTLGNSVVKLLSGDNKNAALVNKIATSVQLNRLPEIPKDEIQMLKLSHTEVKVPTVKISEIHGEPVYVRVNPETGDRYGRRYIKNEPGELIELSNRAAKVKYPETRVKGLERWRSFDHEELTLKEVTSHHSGFSTTLDSSGKITGKLYLIREDTVIPVTEIYRDKYYSAGSKDNIVILEKEAGSRKFEIIDRISDKELSQSMYLDNTGACPVCSVDDY